jgi:hypothetical protein
VHATHDEAERDALNVMFPRESHYVIPGKAGMQILFPGIIRKDFFLVNLKKLLSKKLDAILVDTIWCTYALYKRLHAHDSGFLSEFITVDGKYRKFQKNIHF